MVEFDANQATFINDLTQKGELRKKQKKDELKKHQIEAQLARLKEKRERNKLNKVVDKRNEEEAKQEV